MLRKLIAIGVLCLSALAFMPAAMASPAPDICILEMAPAIDVAHDVTAVVPACIPAILATHIVAALSSGGDEGEAAGPCAVLQSKPLEFAGARLHFDPGRCSV